MEDCKEKPKQAEERIASEIKQFQAMGAWCTPEFLMRASQSVQKIQRVGQEPSGPASTAAGRYLASRTPLAAAGQINQIVGELQRLLRSPKEETDSATRNELLQMWM